jgi:hypothetical protein
MHLLSVAAVNLREIRCRPESSSNEELPGARFGVRLQMLGQQSVGLFTVSIVLLWKVVGGGSGERMALLPSAVVKVAAAALPGAAVSLLTPSSSHF